MNESAAPIALPQPAYKCRHGHVTTEVLSFTFRSHPGAPPDCESGDLCRECIMRSSVCVSGDFSAVHAIVVATSATTAISDWWCIA